MGPATSQAVVQAQFGELIAQRDAALGAAVRHAGRIAELTEALAAQQEELVKLRLAADSHKNPGKRKDTPAAE